MKQALRSEPRELAAPRVLGDEVFENGRDRACIPGAAARKLPKRVPHALKFGEPCVNLSIHTATDVRPLPCQRRQWTKRVGLAR
jgi:hypothetical protein